jgi:hypothetical protein
VMTVLISILIECDVDEGTNGDGEGQWGDLYITQRQRSVSVLLWAGIVNDHRRGLHGSGRQQRMGQESPDATCCRGGQRGEMECII